MFYISGASHYALRWLLNTAPFVSKFIMYTVLCNCNILFLPCELAIYILFCIYYLIFDEWWKVLLVYDFACCMMFICLARMRSGTTRKSTPKPSERRGTLWQNHHETYDDTREELFTRPRRYCTNIWHNIYIYYIFQGLSSVTLPFYSFTEMLDLYVTNCCCCLWLI